MKAKKSGSTKGTSSGKRTVKDLPARKSENIRGGWNTTLDLATDVVLKSPVGSLPIVYQALAGVVETAAAVESLVHH
jgi:hypothetical protein